MNQRANAILRKFIICVPALVLVFACSLSDAQGDTQETLLMRLNPGASIVKVAQDYGLYVSDSIPDRNVYEVYELYADSVWSTVFYLNIDSRVQYCEVETSIATPELQAAPFHISFDKSVDASAYIHQVAYKLVHITGPGAQPTPVTVAVLDTGANLSHTSLAGRLVSGYNALDPTVDPQDIPDGFFNTAVGHGTMIAGIVAATSANSMIMPIRVLNADGTGTIMQVMKGIDYAVQHGAGVINMSFDTDTNSVALEDAIEDAYNHGIVLVASAGNESTSAPRYPAAYPGVIGVASMENDWTLSPFSNFGGYVTLVAPGSSIRSTYWQGDFATWSGTSFAAPFVAAEAAEILARNLTWSPARVTSTMLRTADKLDRLNPTFANMLGAGIINIRSAINHLGQ